MNLRIVLTLIVLLATALTRALADPAPSPSPSSSPASDPCGDTALLATLNRPTIGSAACSVKPGALVGEFGYTNEQIVTANSRAASVTYPQGFLRFGVSRDLELDINGPVFAVQSAAGMTQRGALDSGLGFKWEYAHDESSAAAIDFLQTFGIGNPSVGGGTSTTTFNFDYGRSFSSALGFGVTLGVQSNDGTALDGSTARFVTLLPSVSITDQIRNNLQLYAETYGQTRLRPDGGSRFAIDGGAQYLVSPRFELDFEAGRTVTDVSRSHYYGFGFGVKI